MDIVLLCLGPLPCMSFTMSFSWIFREQNWKFSAQYRSPLGMKTTVKGVQCWLLLHFSALWHCCWCLKSHGSRCTFQKATLQWVCGSYILHTWVFSGWFLCFHHIWSPTTAILWWFSLYVFEIKRVVLPFAFRGFNFPLALITQWIPETVRNKWQSSGDKGGKWKDRLLLFIWTFN